MVRTNATEFPGTVNIPPNRWRPESYGAIAYEENDIASKNDLFQNIERPCIMERTAIGAFFCVFGLLSVDLETAYYERVLLGSLPLSVYSVVMLGFCEEERRNH